MDLFDILGPVMIGPSSSHTAGAARIGRIARQLLNETPVHADIFLYGSFKKTYIGHGTDRAIIGGLLNMAVDDPRLRESTKEAEKQGLKYTFQPIDLKNAHPNTVVIELQGETGKKVKVRAASVGGGNIRVESINGLEVGFSGDNTTLVLTHHDAPGAIASVSECLAKNQLNIATMRVFRSEIGGDAIMAIELDVIPEQHVMDQLLQASSVKSVTLLHKL